MDILYYIIALVSKGSSSHEYASEGTTDNQPGVQIWRMITDWQVKGFKKEVQDELAQRGYYQASK
jgi:hypothetical protein